MAWEKQNKTKQTDRQKKHFKKNFKDIGGIGNGCCRWE